MTSLGSRTDHLGRICTASLNNFSIIASSGISFTVLRCIWGINFVDVPEIVAPELLENLTTLKCHTVINRKTFGEGYPSDTYSIHSSYLEYRHCRHGLRLFLSIMITGSWYIHIIWLHLAPVTNLDLRFIYPVFPSRI